MANVAASNDNLTELGFIFHEEGYESLIDKVKKTGQEVTKLAQAEELRVEAAAKVAKATSTLSDQLDRSIIAYKGSKAESFEYRHTPRDQQIDHKLRRS